MVSTGTWVISMAVGASPDGLDPRRDTLINVDAFGDPVPSARFMGGREWATAMGGRAPATTPADEAAVLARRALLLPAIEPGSGPFAGRQPSWTVPEHSLSDGERAVVVSFYLALMTATCLADIHADGPVLLEGPFAANEPYCRMLAAATGRRVLASAGTGTSAGAALLAAPGAAHASAPGDDRAATRPEPGGPLAAYAAEWRSRL